MNKEQIAYYTDLLEKPFTKIEALASNIATAYGEHERHLFCKNLFAAFALVIENLIKRK